MSVAVHRACAGCLHGHGSHARAGGALTTTCGWACGACATAAFESASSAVRKVREKGEERQRSGRGGPLASAATSCSLRHACIHGTRCVMALASGHAVTACSWRPSPQRPRKQGPVAIRAGLVCCDSMRSRPFKPLQGLVTCPAASACASPAGARVHCGSTPFSYSRVWQQDGRAVRADCT